MTRAALAAGSASASRWLALAGLRHQGRSGRRPEPTAADRGREPVASRGERPAARLARKGSPMLDLRHRAPARHGRRAGARRRRAGGGRRSGAPDRHRRHQRRQPRPVDPERRQALRLQRGQLRRGERVRPRACSRSCRRRPCTPTSPRAADASSSPGRSLADVLARRRRRWRHGDRAGDGRLRRRGADAGDGRQGRGGGARARRQAARHRQLRPDADRLPARRARRSAPTCRTTGGSGRSTTSRSSGRIARVRAAAGSRFERARRPASAIARRLSGSRPSAWIISSIAAACSMPRTCRCRRSPRRSARRSTSIPTATLTRHYRVFEEALAGLRPPDLLRDEGELQPRGAAADGLARRRHGRGLGGRVPAGAGGRGAGRADRLLRASARPAGEMRLALEGGIRQFNVEIEPELAALSEVARGHGRGGADRDPGQPGRRRADPRQDRHRQVGEQVRHPDRAGARGLCRGGAAAGDRGRRDRRAHRQPAHRARALRGGLRQGGGADARRCAPTGTTSAGSTSAAASASPTGASNEAPPLPFDYGEVIRRTVGHLGCEIEIEPGRLIAGNAGVLLAAVIYRKHGEGRDFLILDAAMNDLIRPAMYDAWHDIVPVRRAGGRAWSWRRSTWSGRSARPATPSPRARPLPPLGGGRPRRLPLGGRLRRGDGVGIQLPAAGAGGAGARGSLSPWCGRGRALTKCSKRDTIPDWIDASA